MKGNVFMQLESVASLVRKYKARWEFCLVKKAHSYYWRRKLAQRN